MSILRGIARPLLALPFVLSGVEALARPAGHRERAAVFASLAEKVGVELDERQTDRATRALGATTALAGLLLAFGKAPRSAALILAAVQLPITVANNPFWTHKGEQRRTDVAGLIAGAGLAGGVLMAAADTHGKPSFSWRRAARVENRAKLQEVQAAFETKYADLEAAYRKKAEKSS